MARCDVCKKYIYIGEEDYFEGFLRTPSNPYQPNKEIHICSCCLPNLDILLKKKSKNVNKKKTN